MIIMVIMLINLVIPDYGDQYGEGSVLMLFFFSGMHQMFQAHQKIVGH